GIKKSSALHAIDGAWFCEQHESAQNNKAFGEITQGKLLVEISELDSFNRAEATKVKAVITCPKDRFRCHGTNMPRTYPEHAYSLELPTVTIVIATTPAVGGFGRSNAKVKSTLTVLFRIVTSFLLKASPNSQPAPVGGTCRCWRQRPKSKRGTT